MKSITELVEVDKSPMDAEELENLSIEEQERFYGKNYRKAFSDNELDPRHAGQMQSKAINESLDRIGDEIAEQNKILQSPRKNTKTDMIILLLLVIGVSMLVFVSYKMAFT